MSRHNITVCCLFFLNSRLVKENKYYDYFPMKFPHIFISDPVVFIFLKEIKNKWFSLSFINSYQNGKIIPVI
jgi:hypothetical protein